MFTAPYVQYSVASNPEDRKLYIVNLRLTDINISNQNKYNNYNNIINNIEHKFMDGTFFVILFLNLLLNIMLIEVNISKLVIRNSNARIMSTPTALP